MFFLDLFGGYVAHGKQNIFASAALRGKSLRFGEAVFTVSEFLFEHAFAVEFCENRLELADILFVGVFFVCGGVGKEIAACRAE